MEAGDGSGPTDARGRVGRLGAEVGGEATGGGWGQGQLRRGAGWPAGRRGGSGGAQGGQGLRRGRGRRGPRSTQSPSPLSGPVIPLPLPLARRHLGPGTRALHPGPKPKRSTAVPGPRSARKQEVSRLLATGTAGYPPSKARCHWSARRGCLARLAGT